MMDPLDAMQMYKEKYKKDNTMHIEINKKGKYKNKKKSIAYNDKYEMVGSVHNSFRIQDHGMCVKRSYNKNSHYNIQEYRD